MNDVFEQDTEQLMMPNFEGIIETIFAHFVFFNSFKRSRPLGSEYGGFQIINTDGPEFPKTCVVRVVNHFETTVAHLCLLSQGL